VVATATAGAAAPCLKFNKFPSAVFVMGLIKNIKA